MIKNSYEDIKPYRTKDGSIIRELMHPDVHGNDRMSLAEATVPVGFETQRHRHRQAEELYHISRGKGQMTLGSEKFAVKTGDTVFVPPGIPHQIRNTGDDPLKILCCCVQPYSHDDTQIISSP